MRLELTVSRPHAEPERRAVEGPVSAGGSRADGLLVPGLAPGALRLVPGRAGLVVEASAPGVRVAGHPVAPGERRLLRPGERAEVHGVTLALGRAEGSADGGTRCAAAALLRDAAAGATPAGARLVVLTGAAAGALHPLGPEQTVGRGRDAAIRIADPRASRVHARLRVESRGASIEDLGSKNGVRVNGVRIEPRRPAPVAAGDEIVLGDTAVALEEGSSGGAGDGSGTPGAAPPRGGRSRAALRLAAAALLALAAAALAFAGS
jgi:hypothetical protein